MRKKMIALIFVAIIIAVAVLFILKNKNHPDTPPDNPPVDAPKIISYSILTTYPHDTSSFTQGLVIYKGDLYEGTGEYRKSKLAEVDLKTGKALMSVDINSSKPPQTKEDDLYFG